MERRISTASRAEDLPIKEDGDNRICKLKRKEWSISKSQVIVEKEPEMELTLKMVTHTHTHAIIKSQQEILVFPLLSAMLVIGNFIKLWEGGVQIPKALVI